MRISRLVVKNFRNLQDLDVLVPASALVVGENRAGKSNLLHALRLVLDPSLSSVQRTLSDEDFSDALGADPMAAGETIEISVELDSFADDAGLIATLNSALVSGEPMRARLTYIFRPLEGVHTAESPTYEWLIFGGDDPERLVGGGLRRYLHHVYMHALRDAEADLATYRRSPLRPLLEDVARSADPQDLAAIAQALANAEAEVAGLKGIEDLTSEIEAQTEKLVGDLHKLEPSLDLAPADPTRTIRTLRLFLDGTAQRGLTTASLGSLNVLYLALMQLELKRRLDKGEIEFALLSIEEPEAHLHPHLQRKMFASLLAADGPKQSTIVSTHSPHIVSAVDPRQLILLRSKPGSTDAFAAASADLDEDEWDDLRRYLDATRAEMVFAKRVLLVEGFAEQVLVARLTQQELDARGVSVCPIFGTHFTSYARFLRAIGTPFAVITDGDAELKAGRRGADRVRRLARKLGMDQDAPELAGLFVGETTFEADLFDASEDNRTAMVDALLSLPLSKAKKADMASAHGNGELDSALFLQHVKGRKGRFAQRLAASAEHLDAPDYVAKAFEHLGL